MTVEFTLTTYVLHKDRIRSSQDRKLPVTTVYFPRILTKDR